MSRRRPGHRILRQGFTLIELLVVLAILATLLSIAAPRYFRSVDQSREVALRQTLLVTRDAIDKYVADSGTYPASLGTLVEKRYLRQQPHDPVTDSKESWILIPPNDSSLPGVADLKSGAPGTSADGIPFRDF